MGKPDAGDAIVATTMFALAFVLFLGVFGVPFLDWIAQLALIIAGAMMLRGALGTNGRVGWTLILLGPALFILPAFAAGLAATLAIVSILGLVVLGATKLFALW